MAASRNWIAVRLTTYEDKAEAEFLSRFFGRRDLPNTTFVLLAPDGRTQLTRTHRGPGQMVGDADDGPAALARYLNEVAARYKPRAKPETLPQSLDFRRALNVAACDNQPLLVLYAESTQARTAAMARIAKLAWDERYIGRLHYAAVSADEELEALDRKPTGAGMMLVEPGRFGLTGTVADEIPLRQLKDLPDRLDAFLAKFTAPDRTHRTHVREGHRQGIKWETVVPQTDGPAYRNNP